MSSGYFNNKKVLVFGLGLLDGGVATANWLIKEGARVTITDLKTWGQLGPSIRKIKGKAVFKLGGHNEEDIKNNDIIVINPDVSVYNKYIELAKKLDKQVENEATIFYKFCPKPIIAVTGTRGKTTTANWTAHLLRAKYKTIASGNSYLEPLLKTLDGSGRFSFVVNEIPSFHLELFSKDTPPPSIAVITNIFRDHLNRYRSFEDYVLTKANIFQNQTGKDHLVLNYDNEWTPFLLKQKTRSGVWFFSMSKLPVKYNGVFYADDGIYFQKNSKAGRVINIKGFAGKWGRHNIGNLLAASLAAYLSGVSWNDISGQIGSLPQISFRQEVIFENKKLKIINDTCATSPEGGIAAVERFGGPGCVLITGGTDRELDYKEWAKVVSKKIRPENMIMLSGSATSKMLSFFSQAYLSRMPVFDNTLKECIETAFKISKNYPGAIILFSPASKSFEKFQNEYDRGEKFNRLVKLLLKNK